MGDMWPSAECSQRRLYPPFNPGKFRQTRLGLRLPDMPVNQFTRHGIAGGGGFASFVLLDFLLFFSLVMLAPCVLVRD